MRRPRSEGMHVPLAPTGAFYERRQNLHKTAVEDALKPNARTQHCSKLSQAARELKLGTCKVRENIEAV